jgi:hypothetical protein
MTSCSDKVQAEALELRKIRHKHAAKVAQQARIIASAARKLIKLEAVIHEASIAVAGEDYDLSHCPSFDLHGSMERQFENMGHVDGPGFTDVLAFAKMLAESAATVANAEEPPPMPYEDIGLKVGNERDRRETLRMLPAPEK